MTQSVLTELVRTTEAKGANSGANPLLVVRTLEISKKNAKPTMSDTIEQWISVEQGANLLGVSKRAIQKGCTTQRYATRRVVGNGGLRYEILLSSLPAEAQAKYWKGKLTSHKAQDQPHVGSSPSDNAYTVVDPDADALAYAQAPDWARRKADKYLALLQATEGMKGNELKNFIAAWNEQNPELKSSYPMVMRMRKEQKDRGVAGLLAGYGKTAGNSTVGDDWFEMWKGLYLKEGGPSAESCWRIVLGAAKRAAPNADLKCFPCCQTFINRLQREVPKDAIYRARWGAHAWNQKYGNYISRDLHDLPAGISWFSDHKQLDVMVTLPSGKRIRPWITVWRDYKSGKWLGWDIHAEAPNSDHIFLAFQRAATAFGTPKHVYIDNGKDYRCRDFAGGRKVVKASLDTVRTRSLLALLDVQVTYARPYNAQAKQIERDFLTVKQWFDKHAPGYTGGNHVERPEVLAAEVRSGKLLTLSEFEESFEQFILSVLNPAPCEGKVHRGRSRDQVWDMEQGVRLERAGITAISEEALGLYCTRVSNDRVIARNGVVENAREGLYYWAEWMDAMKGQKVYLRRDPRKYQRAWVFRATDDEYLGTAILAPFTAAALADTDLQKRQLEEALRRKRATEKATMAHLRNLPEMSLTDKLVNMAAGHQELIGDSEAVVIPTNVITLTRMDEVVMQESQMLATGTHDIRAIMPTQLSHREIVLFKSDLPKEAE